MTGFGKFAGFSGDAYEGGWLNGMRHGLGRATWPDGRVYEGEWLEDVQSGRGKPLMIAANVSLSVWEHKSMSVSEHVLDVQERVGRRTLTR